MDARALNRFARTVAGLHSDDLSDFSGIVPLKVDEIENFALPWRQDGEKVADVRGDALSVHSPAGVGVVNGVHACQHGVREPRPPLLRSRALKRHVAGDAVDPPLE